VTTLALSQSPSLFKTLGNELRWKLLSALMDSDFNVLELVQLVKEKQNLVSYHLKRLEDQGLVNEQRSIADGREVYYSADVEELQRLFFSAGEALHPALGGKEESQAPASFDDLHKPVRVLFLCTHNSARSQMAEGIMRAKGGDLVEVQSAGTEATLVRPLAIKALANMGIDISSHHSKTLDQFLEQKFDFVITVCDRAKESCPIFPGHPHQIHWSFPDPSEAAGSEEEQLKVYEDVALELNRRINYLLMMIKGSL